MTTEPTTTEQFTAIVRSLVAEVDAAMALGRIYNPALLADLVELRAALDNVLHTLESPDRPLRRR